MNWSYLLPTNEAITVTHEELRKLALGGGINPETRVWNEKLNGWRAAEEVWPLIIGHEGRESPPPLPAFSFTPAPLSPPPLPQASGSRRPHMPPPLPTAGSRGMLLRIMVIPWVVIFIGFVWSGISRMRDYREVSYQTGPTDPFAEADFRVSGGGNNGFSPAERDAAKTFASMAENLRNVNIEKSSGPGPGVWNRMRSAGDSHGFVSYCKRRGDQIVFLLRVPVLRDFEHDAKIQMAENAWIAGLIAISEMPEPRPTQMVVAIREFINYDCMFAGTSLNTEALKSGFEITDQAMRHKAMGIDSMTEGNARIRQSLVEYFRTMPPPSADAKSPAEGPIPDSPSEPTGVD